MGLHSERLPGCQGHKLTPKVAENPRKSCFFICPIGDDGSPTRKRADQVARHLVRPATEPAGFRVTRADEVSDEGLITHQVIERLFDSDLVVADLTDLNANVFYELAVRHAVRRPVVHLIATGQEIPFDLKDVRVAAYDLTDPDLLNSALGKVSGLVKAIVESDEPGPNPISSARDLQLLRQSGEPEVRELGEVLTAVADIRRELGEVLRAVRAPVAGGRRLQFKSLTPSPGDRFSHRTFGRGAVTALEPGSVAVVKFDNEDRTRRLMWDYAPVEFEVEDKGEDEEDYDEEREPDFDDEDEPEEDYDEEREPDFDDEGD